MMSKAAVFWDRDGTLIADPGYLNDPDQVQLLPGAAEALRRLTEAGFENVVVTNQSGIARGLLDEGRLKEIHARMEQRFAAAGARIDAIYYCPYLDGPEAVVAEYRKDSDLRKPKPGMLIQASLERKIDLTASWSIGNSLRDAEAGRAAGCRTILLASDSGPTIKSREVDFVAASLPQAVEIVLKYSLPKQNQEKVTMEESEKNAETPDLLREILNFLRTAERRAQAEDFSLIQLAGAITQMLALTAFIWAVFSMIRGGNALDLLSGIQKLLFSIFLQLFALALFIIARKKNP